MKYIKEYKDISNSNLMEDLEDYLQEIFDEFHIVKAGKAEIIGDNPIYDIYNIKHNYTSGPTWERHIDIYSNKRLGSILQRLEEKKELIEQRLGQEIHIKRGAAMYRGTAYNVIQITILPGVPGHFNEAVEPPEWEKYRQKIKDGDKYKDVYDMADCFQEVFDKFNIPQIENPNEDTWDISTPFWTIPKSEPIPGSDLTQGDGNPTNILIMNLRYDFGQTEILEDVFIELLRVKKVCEKRLGFNIEIKNFATGIIISPKYGFHAKLKEEATFRSNDKFEDLTEYLQEFFDKYHIIYDETGEENKKFLSGRSDKNSWAVGIKEVENPHTRLTRRKPYILLMMSDSDENGWLKRQNEIVTEIQKILLKIEKRIGQNIKFDPSTFNRGQWIRTANGYIQYKLLIEL